MSISEATLAVDMAADEASRRVERRDAVLRLLNEADALLGKLERLNLADQESVPAWLRSRLVAWQREVHGVTLGDQATVILRTQEAMDAVYESLEIVLGWRRRERGLVASYDPEDQLDEPEVRAHFRARAVREALKEDGVSEVALLAKSKGVARARREEWLKELIDEGLLRREQAPPGRRYFAVGEGG